jgi:hypothetical protein
MSGYTSHPALSRACLLLTIGLLCLGVLLQMLGVAISFWDLNGSDDLLITSILTGFAVLSEEAVFLVLDSLFTSIPTASLYEALVPDGFFHPPMSSV